MKIYNYIKIDIDTNEVIEEDSFEYDGPIEECKGDVNVPPPSQEEIMLQKEILSQLQDSRQLQEQFMPLLLQSSGYKYDDNNKLVKMGYDEYLDTLDPIMRKQYENLDLIQERTNQALKGELPVSAALEQGISDQRQQMDENLSRRLGSNYALSSAGIKSSQEFDKSSEALREQARQGAINQYANLGYGGTQLLGLTPQGQNSQAAGLSSYNSSLIPSYSSALQPYQNQRNMQLNANMQNSQNSSNMMSGLFSGLGSLAGMGLGGYFAGRSNK